MKKIMIALVAMLTMSVSTHAMSYEQARNEALFLTDKMAYELNLTDEQYEAAYEINLDYLMGVTSVDDVYGPYWERRNLDLSYILLEAQWNAFIAASYFYRPLYWDAGYWHFGIYARYPRTSMPPIVADMPGTALEDTATTTDVATTSVTLEDTTTSACVTTGIAVTIVTATASAQRTMAVA